MAEPQVRTSSERLVTASTIIAAVFFLSGGAWAFLGPASFFQNLAHFEPYNRHLIHDVGAFQIGLGAAMLLALWRSDALFVVLAAAASAGWVHALSHVLDRDLGGRPTTDIPGLAVFAAIVTVGAVARGRGTHAHQH